VLSDAAFRTALEQGGMVIGWKWVDMCVTSAGAWNGWGRMGWTCTTPQIDVAEDVVIGTQVEPAV
jgi:hypothetical protein